MKTNQESNFFHTVYNCIAWWDKADFNMVQEKKKEFRMVKGTGPTGPWQLWSHTRQAAAAERYTPVCA